MAKCKVCGNELVKKKTKSGEVVFYCTECKKIYRLKAKAEEAKKNVEEEEEEEETPVAPKKVAKAAAPVVEKEEEEEEEETPVVAPIPVVAKEESAVAPTNNASLDSIAESLAEINTSLKGLLKIFNNIYKS